MDALNEGSKPSDETVAEVVAAAEGVAQSFKVKA